MAGVLIVIVKSNKIADFYCGKFQFLIYCGKTNSVGLDYCVKEVSNMSEAKPTCIVAIFPRPSNYSRLTAIKMFKDAGYNVLNIEWHLMPNGWVQAEPIFA